MAVKKRSSGPRNNLTYHPLEVRLHVYQLLLDGETGKHIIENPLVAASILKTGRRLFGNTFTAVKRGREYEEYRQSTAGMTQLEIQFWQLLRQLTDEEKVKLYKLAVEKFPGK